MPSNFCSELASPSVTVARDCVSPRVKRADPCARGRMDVDIFRGRTERVSRPSGRTPPSATMRRRVLPARALKLSCTSASSMGPTPASPPPPVLRAEWGGASSARRGSAGAAEVSSISTRFWSALKAASRSCLVLFHSASSMSEPTRRATSASTASGMGRRRWLAFALPTCACHAATAAHTSRTASWPKLAASRMSLSGTKSQKPSIMSMASLVPATTRLRSDAVCAATGALRAKAPSGPRDTRTQATGLSKGTSEMARAAADAHTARQSGGALPSYERT
mmetsp:Transcript_22386/g.66016  ORF Transcript_22386/g.66016 Transcript_22386/m.66016 type:complete len:280 (-) Transcript_22386:115-954(-)